MDTLTIVTFGIFIVGLVFHAGVMHQRVSTLERDMNRVYDELRGIRASTDEIKGMIRGEVQ